MASDDVQGETDGRGDALPTDVAEAVRGRASSRDARDQKPEWTDRFVWDSLWKVIVVAAAALLIAFVALRAQHLLRLLAISVFFSMAMVPAVNYMQRRWRWRRGAAVGAIYAGLFLFVTLMVLVLIPGIAEFASQVGDSGDDWISDLNAWTEETFEVTIVEQSAAEEATLVTEEALTEWADEILGVASSGIGLIFDLATIALFTFYFAADYGRIERSILSKMPPDRQRIYGWVSDTALDQTGGYFYSRMLLMLVNGVLFFAAMVLVGMPVVYALPLSLFEAFVATFIPAVGTYIGAAVPILVTLGVQGFTAALILLVWTIVYQQVENYWLSPKLSSQTMELNGGVAFGAALAGGAIAGPMGAFMALPVAALITAVISNLGKTYEIVYQEKYADDLTDWTDDAQANSRSDTGQ
ncbi:MAG: AI-2E family transporter [Acidimicrobiales bacterium]